MCFMTLQKMVNPLGGLVEGVPVVCEGLCVLSVERACAGKHDGGVQISDDARHSTGSSNAGLSATIARLKSRQHVRHLRERVKTSGVCSGLT